MKKGRLIFAVGILFVLGGAAAAQTSSQDIERRCEGGAALRNAQAQCNTKYAGDRAKQECKAELQQQFDECRDRLTNPLRMPGGGRGQR